MLDNGRQLESSLRQLLAELNFTQSVSDLVALRDQLNPSLKRRVVMRSNGALRVLYHRCSFFLPLGGRYQLPSGPG